MGGNGEKGNGERGKEGDRRNPYPQKVLSGKIITTNTNKREKDQGVYQLAARDRRRHPNPAVRSGPRRVAETTQETGTGTQGLSSSRGGRDQPQRTAGRTCSKSSLQGRGHRHGAELEWAGCPVTWWSLHQHRCAGRTGMAKCLTGMPKLGNRPDNTTHQILLYAGSFKLTKCSLSDFLQTLALCYLQ